MTHEKPRGADRLIVAIDTGNVEIAKDWIAACLNNVGMFKVGLELFTAHGAAGYAAVAEAGKPIFLDLKLHDIPNTVSGAVRSVLPLAPRMITLHASGGTAMISAARHAVEMAGATRPLLLAVTVLTSLDASALSAIGVAGGPTQQVLRLARLALDAGADGLVCSPREVAVLRDAFGPGPALVVPGIRPENAGSNDQARVMTPEQAIAAGADWIVVGRPITGAENPAEAAAAIAAVL